MDARSGEPALRHAWLGAPRRGERVRARARAHAWTRVGRMCVPRAGSERRRAAAAARGRARSGSRGRACAGRAALGSVREEREEGERRKGGGERKRKEKMENGKKKKKKKKKRGRERAIVLRRRLRPQSATRSGRVRARNEGHREMGPGIRVQGRRFLSSTMKDFKNYI